jgi:hypothetical protein
MKAEIDSFDRNVIRMTMEDFYIRQVIVPSVGKLLVALKQKIVSMAKRRPYSDLNDIGFTWKISVSKRKVSPIYA